MATGLVRQAVRKLTGRTQSQDATSPRVDPWARVLVINDEAPIRLLVRVNFESEGAEVLEAADGIAGLELARAEYPDLILLDVMMPGMLGWEVAEQLRAVPATRDIPIVFLSPHNDGWPARAFDLRAVDYIVCPFDPLELPTTIRGHLERIGRGEREALRRESQAALEAESVE